MVVVGKLRQGEECVPVVLSFSNEEPQVLFQFLVDPFRLSVGLQMVSGRRRGFDSQQSVQFLHEGSDELRSAVGDDLLREAMKFPDVPKVEVRCPGSGDCGDCFDEVRTFTAESTATMMESYPPDSGSSEMKSTLMTSQCSSGIGSGWSSSLGKRRCYESYL